MSPLAAMVMSPSTTSSAHDGSRPTGFVSKLASERWSMSVDIESHFQVGRRVSSRHVAPLRGRVSIQSSAGADSVLGSSTGERSVAFVSSQQPLQLGRPRAGMWSSAAGESKSSWKPQSRQVSSSSRAFADDASTTSAARLPNDWKGAANTRRRSLNPRAGAWTRTVRG